MNAKRAFGCGVRRHVGRAAVRVQAVVPRSTFQVMALSIISRCGYLDISEASQKQESPPQQRPAVLATQEQFGGKADLD